MKASAHDDNTGCINHVPCAFAVPLPITSSTKANFTSLSQRRHYLKRERARVVARFEPPPKPGFYKNPSRAIEKGGGFFIPGLRGPRLRFLVPVVSGLFLVANHAAGGTSTDALTRTEVLDIIAAVGLLGTALYDVLSDRKQASANTTRESTAAKITREEVEVTSPRSESRTNSGEWACAIVRDLEPNVEIAHFRKNEIMLSTENVVNASGGIGVKRVMKEQKAVYIAKRSSLPEEVSIPFLPDGEWSIFMVPTSTEDVVVFASRDELSRDRRRWLEIFSAQIPE